MKKTRQLYSYLYLLMLRFFKLLLISLIMFFSFYYSILATEHRNRIFTAMKEELVRSRNQLHMADYQIPYFISYSIRETETISIWGRLGTVLSSDNSKDRTALVDVRVGNYDMDNSELDGSGFDFGGLQRISAALYNIPLDDDEMAIRGVLWYLTDLKYKTALENYSKKRGKQVFEVPEDTIPDFSHELSSHYQSEEVSFHVDNTYWENAVRKISGYLGSVPEILESSVQFSGKKNVTYFINTEGTEVVTEQTYFTLGVDAMVKSSDGMPLENFRTFNSCVYQDMPPLDSIEKSVHTMVQELYELRKAEELQPYVGPAILESGVVGVIFHEAIGHRLEGERQRRKESGQTFKGKVGQNIIPNFLSIIDDPTLQQWNNKMLFGHYKYDNEGVPAQRVVLIDQGILMNYLMSRTPIKGFLNSNGHGRSDGSPFYGNPMGRMGVTMVNAERTVSYDSLKTMLLEECRKQKKPYGLIIKQVRGGETSTQRFGYQAFKESTVLVYKIDAGSGKESLVRGVEIVGTPLTSINKIVAACNDYGVFNGYCGAESGYIPVSTIAPTVLTQEVELQKSSATKSKPPILPPPYMEGK